MTETSQQSTLAEELAKRIAVLERKAAREKKARSLAESLLEQYSLEIYQTNESLKRALDSSTKKQAELAYLGEASSGVASELSLNDMISNVIQLTGKFCRSSFGCYVVSTVGGVVDSEPNSIWNSQEGWQEDHQVRSLIQTLIPLDSSRLLNEWVVSSVVLKTDIDEQSFRTLFYTNFALENEKIGWLAFLNEEYGVDSDMISVLDTARDHLLSGVRRRLADARILRRNVQLQESLEKLEKARMQLIQSEKMASLGQLAAGVAHEINNPIAFIRSNMEVLQQYLMDYNQLHHELRERVDDKNVLTERILKEAYDAVDLAYIEEDASELLASNLEGLDRVKDIVDNLKSFSHAGDESTVAMSLFDCIEAALKVTSNVFKYEHTIDNQFAESCALIKGNIGQLQQVFVNLFVNAAYAMEGGGKLTISHSEENKKVAIHVSDTGTGMDKKTISQLFTPFFTTKPVGVGTGLGLSISYAILEAHNAEVTVDSELGVGTTFNLVFPIAEE